MAEYPLAVIAPYLGDVSETFVYRHIEQLLAGRTVTIIGSRTCEFPGFWDVTCPAIVLDAVRADLARGMVRRVVNGTLRRLRLPREESIVKRFLRRHGVKVILSEWLDRTLPWLDVARDMGIPLFAHGFGYDIHRLLRDPKWRAEYLKYNSAAGVITVSELSRSRLERIGIEPSKLSVIYSGVDVPDAPIHRNGSRVVRCLAVGRMAPVKAPILILDGFRRATNRFDGLRLDYVGGGALLPAAQQYVRASGLADRVTLHGPQPSATVQTLLRTADIFIHHSVTLEDGMEEGLPVVILEAMAAALPVVSSRIGGVPEAVVDGETGWLVDEWDTVTMAERIVALAESRALRLAMGEAGWRRAAERFTWRRERSELLHLLGSCL